MACHGDAFHMEIQPTMWGAHLRWGRDAACVFVKCLVIRRTPTPHADGVRSCNLRPAGWLRFKRAMCIRATGGMSLKVEHAHKGCL